MHRQDDGKYTKKITMIIHVNRQEDLSGLPSSACSTAGGRYYCTVNKRHLGLLLIGRFVDRSSFLLFR